MDNLKFYPCLTPELLNKAGCVSEKYQFFYYPKIGRASCRERV